MKGEGARGAELIGVLIIAAIAVSIGVQVFLDTTPPIIEASQTGTGEPLENLSVTGKTVASFVPLLYIVLPLAFVGGVAAGLVIMGKRLIG